MRCAGVYRKNAVMATGICNWSGAFAMSVWDRINFCRRYPANHFKIYETTITQNLLFDFFNLAVHNSNVLMFESVSETANGNDIEVYVSLSSNRFLFYAVQAKIVYKNGGYRKIDHSYTSKPQFQIDRLISYAVGMMGLPIYFLYSESPCFDPNKIARNGQCFGNFGVSVANAHDIKQRFFLSNRVNIPYFKDMIPDNAITLAEFLCTPKIRNAFAGIIPDKTVLLLQDYPASLFTETNVPIERVEATYRIYTLEELTAQTEWIDISSSDDDVQHRIIESESPEDFSPKYRIIIDTEAHFEQESE